MVLCCWSLTKNVRKREERRCRRRRGYKKSRLFSKTTQRNGFEKSKKEGQNRHARHRKGENVFAIVLQDLNSSTEDSRKRRWWESEQEILSWKEILFSVSKLKTTTTMTTILIRTGDQVLSVLGKEGSPQEQEHQKKWVNKVRRRRGGYVLKKKRLNV
jgi:hypothetical protein